MKNILYIILFIVLVGCKSKPVELSIMTYNIRMDTPYDSINSWPYRKDVAAEVIKNHDIDILGAQEVLVNQLNDLKERLPEYNTIGVGREDGKEKGEFSIIFYKKNRFDEIESGNFWLSETPELAGSKGWDAACERIATWTVLKEKKSGKQLFFLNTHLDHIGTIARSESIKLILEKCEDLSKDYPVIITGDFNSIPESTVIGKVLETEKYLDSRQIAAQISGNYGTYHEYGRFIEEDRDLIDYIFVSKGIKVNHYEVLPDKHNGTYLSDHVPVIAEIIIE